MLLHNQVMMAKKVTENDGGRGRCGHATPM